MLSAYLVKSIKSVFNVKALVGTFNQEKAQVRVFSVIGDCENFAKVRC